MESSFIIALLALTIITFILTTFVFTKKYQFLITCYSLGAIVFCLLYLYLGEVVSHAYAKDAVETHKNEVQALSRFIQEQVTYEEALNSSLKLSEISELPSGVEEEARKGVQIDPSTTLYFDEKGQVVDVRGRFVSKNLLKEPE